MTIVGGGLAGCSVAAQLCERAEEPLDINIIDSRSVLGAGVAYSADDPDHRLNAPLFVHFLSPGLSEDFQKWFVESGGLVRDSNALAADSQIYARRLEVSKYIAEKMEEYAQRNNSNSTITHLRDQVIDITVNENTYLISTEKGLDIQSDRLVLATGNQKLNAPPPFNGDLINHPAFFKSPWELENIRCIDANAPVLIVGAGLTMSDVVATLIGNGHQGSITAISRNGLRPQRHVQPPEHLPPRNPLEGVMADKPEHLNGTLLEIFTCLRKRMQKDIESGGHWQWAFDELRDCVWQIWPTLSDADKRKYLRHLRPWYDSHRFRLPPQTAIILDKAISDGILNYKKADITSARAIGNRISIQFQESNSDNFQTVEFDAVINCTGPALSPSASENPIYQSLLTRGLARSTAIGIGFDVDKHSRAIRLDGSIDDNMFIVGPPTVGAWGDPIGAPFIVAQIHRAIPKMLA